LENWFKDGTSFIRATSTGHADFPALKTLQKPPSSRVSWAVDVGEHEAVDAASVTWNNGIFCSTI
jgi:hypothetical protein